MFRIFIAVICLTITTACGRHHKEVGKDVGDTLRLNNSISVEKLIHSVYEISPGTIAVNFSESDSNKILDSIFYSIIKIDRSSGGFDKPANGYHYDTAGAYFLQKNDILSTEIKKHLLPAYYIYGTHGCAKCKVKDVIFSLDECRTSIFAFTVEGFDVNKYGHPLICCERPLSLTYGGNYRDIEQKIAELIKGLKSDYPDNMKTTVFANVDSFYFTYSDDFKWGAQHRDTSCYFPSRAIMVLQTNSTIKGYWCHDLDLFGIPCD